MHEDVDMPERRFTDPANKRHPLLMLEMPEVQRVLRFLLQKDAHIFRQLHKLEISLLSDHDRREHEPSRTSLFVGQEFKPLVSRLIDIDTEAARHVADLGTLKEGYQDGDRAAGRMARNCLLPHAIARCELSAGLLRNYRI